METSQRIVDVVLGALAQALPEVVPAASQGTMNNVAFGGVAEGRPFVYYETIGGGHGAGPAGKGVSGRHSHMTNTRNTPVEALEPNLPVRVLRYSLRDGSGGSGRYSGGLGIRREYAFLAPATVTLNTERRRYRPYGLQGGQPGAAGRNRIVSDGTETELSAKSAVRVQPGDRLIVETPGGGGWGTT
jgi:N-methylhydantoinase B